MTTIGIDPGPSESALIQWHGDFIGFMGHFPNADIIDDIPSLRFEGVVGIEMVACYGMAVGQEVFQTCVFIGELKNQFRLSGRTVLLIERRLIKMHFCQSMRAKDSNIRQSLIDRLGPPGTKKAQGKTYGVSKHLWSALAIAVYVADKSPKEQPEFLEAVK